MSTNSHLACSLTPLLLATFLLAYVVVFLTTDLGRRKDFLDLIAFSFGLVIHWHWGYNFCSQDLTRQVFNHPLNNSLNDFFIIPFCMHPFAIAAVRWLIERLQAADACWHKSILVFTLLEMLLILYVYHALSIVADCLYLQLTQGWLYPQLTREVELPYGTVQSDLLFIESTKFVLKYWFFYGIWRVKYIPHGERVWSQHFVWIFIVFVGSSFALIDLFIPPTKHHAWFFQTVVLYTLLEYFCISKLLYPPLKNFYRWLTVSVFLFSMYLHM